jgi:hypothetical protein
MPGKPEECLLELGVHLQTWFIFLFGVAFVGVGGFWMRPPIVAMAKRA